MRHARTAGATTILIAYRHGLRASELVALRWDDIDFTAGKVHVRRAKGGMTSVHPLGGKELRALRRLQRETPEGARTVYVFVSERVSPLSVPGYQRMVARAGAAAHFPFLVDSHMLRHSCGYNLANDGHYTRAIQHYLGHRSIASTVRYTALAPDRFKGFWKIEPAPACGRPGTKASRSHRPRAVGSQGSMCRTSPSGYEQWPVRVPSKSWGPTYRTCGMGRYRQSARPLPPTR
jgi:type 1 fimbriae regulatory protein FimB/type 1 fimbriae regulatory protein FimE